MPQPLADNATVPFWKAAAEHRFVVETCSDCAQMRLPAAPVCSGCRSESSEWEQISGKGELYTYTIVHRPIAADMKVPFIVAVVDLEGADGVRFITNLVETEVEELEIGMPLEVAWEDMGPKLTIPRFRKVRG
jgi:uncharacterized OB-fold protein